MATKPQLWKAIVLSLLVMVLLVELSAADGKESYPEEKEAYEEEGSVDYALLETLVKNLNAELVSLLGHTLDKRKRHVD